MKYVKMILVLTGIALVSGGLLGGLHAATKQKIAEQTLNRKKLPAVRNIFPDAENDLVADHLEFDSGGEEPVYVFVIKKGGKPIAIALEGFGKGYGGDVGVMVGFNIETGKLVGISVTTHSETPGVGSKITENHSFLGQFEDIPADPEAKIKKDGGKIDAISGATFSSRAVATAVGAAVRYYQTNEAEIKGKVGL